VSRGTGNSRAINFDRIAGSLGALDSYVAPSGSSEFPGLPRREVPSLDVGGGGKRKGKGKGVPLFKIGLSNQ
jgi:hypothetical protein